ncbi:unnamed protein product [Fasciola hepatica]|uniref:Uncharacterized protein n=1 Tax=Fasciola hepatica TaxID=6192 RepID=A0ABC9HI26_FASHE
MRFVLLITLLSFAIVISGSRTFQFPNADSNQYSSRGSMGSRYSSFIGTKFLEYKQADLVENRDQFLKDVINRLLIINGVASKRGMNEKDQILLSLLIRYFKTMNHLHQIEPFVSKRTITDAILKTRSLKKLKKMTSTSDIELKLTKEELLAMSTVFSKENMNKPKSLGKYFLHLMSMKRKAENTQKSVGANLEKEDIIKGWALLNPEMIAKGIKKLEKLIETTLVHVDVKLSQIEDALQIGSPK